MAGPARRVRTFDELYAEILRLPAGLTGEILEGDAVRVMSRPGKRHRRAAGACLDALSGANGNLRGWEVPWSWLVDPGLRMVEVYQAVNGLPALVTAAQDDERCVLPPFELEIARASWWLPGPPLTE